MKQKHWNSETQWYQYRYLQYGNANASDDGKVNYLAQSANQFTRLTLGSDMDHDQQGLKRYLIPISNTSTSDMREVLKKGAQDFWKKCY